MLKESVVPIPTVTIKSELTTSPSAIDSTQATLEPTSLNIYFDEALSFSPLQFQKRLGKARDRIFDLREKGELTEDQSQRVKKIMVNILDNEKGKNLGILMGRILHDLSFIQTQLQTKGNNIHQILEPLLTFPKSESEIEALHLAQHTAETEPDRKIAQIRLRLAEELSVVPQNQLLQVREQALNVEKGVEQLELEYGETTTRVNFKERLYGKLREVEEDLLQGRRYDDDVERTRQVERAIVEGFIQQEVQNGNLTSHEVLLNKLSSWDDHVFSYRSKTIGVIVDAFYARERSLFAWEVLGDALNKNDFLTAIEAYMELTSSVIELSQHLNTYDELTARGRIKDIPHSLELSFVSQTPVEQNDSQTRPTYRENSYIPTKEDSLFRQISDLMDSVVESAGDMTARIIKNIPAVERNDLRLAIEEAVGRNPLLEAFIKHKLDIQLPAWVIDHAFPGVFVTPNILKKIGLGIIHVPVFIGGVIISAVIDVYDGIEALFKRQPAKALFYFLLALGAPLTPVATVENALYWDIPTQRVEHARRMAVLRKVYNILSDENMKGTKEYNIYYGYLKKIINGRDIDKLKRKTDKRMKKANDQLFNLVQKLQQLQKGEMNHTKHLEAFGIEMRIQQQQNNREMIEMVGKLIEVYKPSN